MENYSQYKKIIWKYIRTLQYDYMYLRGRHFRRVDYPQISESIIRMKYIAHTLFCWGNERIDINLLAILWFSTK